MDPTTVSIAGVPERCGESVDGGGRIGSSG
jgi:hypothetical protein